MANLDLFFSCRSSSIRGLQNGVAESVSGSCPDVVIPHGIAAKGLTQALMANPPEELCMVSIRDDALIDWAVAVRDVADRLSNGILFQANDPSRAAARTSFGSGSHRDANRRVRGRAKGPYIELNGLSPFLRFGLFASVMIYGRAAYFMWRQHSKRRVLQMDAAQLQ